MAEIPTMSNVFISHVHEDDPQLGAMKVLLETRRFPVRDSSINSSRPNNAHESDYIKESILAPAIQWAGTLVVLVSPQTHESEWVNWEIEYAQQLGKRIVGVWAQGATDSDLPEALERYADAVVGWQADRIAGAILGEINDWTTSDGRKRDTRTLARYSC
jgi:MTH538 TIR-like domain (DUF1863)